MVTTQDLARAVSDIRARGPRYRTLLDYAEGRHNLLFATEKFRNAFGELFREFADNMLDSIIDEPTSRARLQSWSANVDTDADLIQQWWRKVRGPSRQRVTHRNAFRVGDGVAMVWPDSTGFPRLYVHEAAEWSLVYSTDDPDLLAVATRVWREGKVWRATVITPDTIERYVAKAAADAGIPSADTFTPYDTAGQAAVETNPWGMPVGHFPVDEVSRYGTSVISDCMSLQDALNKSVADMLTAMEAVAYPQRWATGLQVEKRPDGTEVNPMESGANRLIWSGSKDAQFGSFPQGDLNGFLDVQDALRLELARKGRLPAHAVHLRGAAAPPSGVSLLVADGRAIKRVRDAEDQWELTWAYLGALALRMMGHDVDPDDLSIEWSDPSTRDEKALMETLAVKKELGVSDRQILTEAGYSQEEIDRMAAEVEEAKQDAAAERMAMGPGMLSGPPAPLARQAVNALGLPAAPPTPAGAPESSLGK